MKYTTGTVAVTNASTGVVGTGTLWTSLTVGSPAPIFSKLNSGVPYYIASITDDTNLILTAPYAGVTESGISYSIANDYSTNLGLPVPQQGDVDNAETLNRLANDIDTHLYNIDGGTI